MATGTLAPVGYFTLEDSAGAPISGGLVLTYVAGTTTPATTYQDAALATPNANPIVADSAGRFVCFLAAGQAYKFLYQSALGVTFKTVDNIQAVPSSASTLDVAGTAGEALTAGQAVYLSDGSGGKTAGQWFRSDATSDYASIFPLVGMVPSAISSGVTGTIRLSGAVTGLTSLTVGTSYYVSGTPGAITATAPSNSRFLGVATATDTLLLSTDPPPAITGVSILQVQVFGG